VAAGAPSFRAFCERVGRPIDEHRSFSQNDTSHEINEKIPYLNRPTKTILLAMPTGLHRYYGANDMHFITCSCFHRRAFLADPARRTLFLKILEEVRQSYQFVIAAYVVMPEHFHLLVTEPERDDLSRVMQVLKQRTAHQLLKELRGSHGPGEDRFWQRRFYDFNVWTAAKHSEKVHYIHLNPVQRGLVDEPEHWLWSSFRAYAYREPGIVLVNAPGSAKLKVKDSAA
jgi:putative transposase